MIPGSNLLGAAFGLIAQQLLLYRQFSGRVKNSQMQYISNFDTPFALAASIQRVPRQQYIEFHLEFQRNYVNVFAIADLVDLQRDCAGDQFIYGGVIYQLESQGTWFLQDGWATAMAVQIGTAVTGADGNPTFPDLVA